MWKWVTVMKKYVTEIYDITISWKYDVVKRGETLWLSISCDNIKILTIVFLMENQGKLWQSQL